MNQLWTKRQIEPEQISSPMAISRDKHSTIGAGQMILNRNLLTALPVVHPKAVNSIEKIDTVFVGLVQHDTMVITGNYQYNGPILVFNDGVLVFKNANATIFGDLWIFQNGKVIADSSNLNFPQQYFYQRSIVLAHHGSAVFTECSFDYSGLSHNLVAVDSAEVTMNNVHQNDWTTAGAYGHGQFNLNGINLAGEYILNDYATMHFANVNTLLLWHQLPDSAVVNFSFPAGDTLSTYSFDNSVAGVQGVEYHTTVDTSVNVWWGLMPANGSSVTISNSKLRTVGMWFQHGDSVHVSGLVNNSTYSNYTAPLSDRIFTLINSSVQTYSLYEFDSSKVDIGSCILGEVGAQGRSFVNSQSFLLDGSGGYFWATDTAAVITSNVAVTAPLRSEGNGLFVAAYCTVSNGTITSLKNSLMVVIQSTIPQEPIPYDGSVAWFSNINQNGAVYANNVVPISGSTWIDQGPQGSWMHFQKYCLYYKPVSATTWNPIVIDSTQEIRNAVLGNWNTVGLASGSYLLRLLTFNDLGDSIEAIKQISLLPAILGIPSVVEGHVSFGVSPNPMKDKLSVTLTLSEAADIQFTLFDLAGKSVLMVPFRNFSEGESSFIIPTEDLYPGTYFLQMSRSTGKHLLSMLVVKE